MSGEKYPCQVSIIMPVYNSEEYVGNAVESILRQDFTDFELLLVDDGSSDKSGEICDRYAESDSRVRVIHQENGGICKARNRALREAKGKYVAFSDNDDEYLTGLLGENVTVAERTGADMVRFLRERILVVDGKTVHREVIRAKGSFETTEENFRENYFDVRKVSGGVWTGLYRNETLKKNSILFNEKMKYGFEDIHFNLQMLEATPHVAVNPKVYYRWIERQSHSTSRKFSNNRFWSLEECLNLEETVNGKYQIREAFPTRWAEYLIDNYLLRVLQLMNRAECSMTRREKVDFLKHFRQNKAFSSLETEKRISPQKMKGKTRLLYSLFMGRHMKALLFLYAANEKVVKRSRQV